MKLNRRRSDQTGKNSLMFVTNLKSIFFGAIRFEQKDDPFLQNKCFFNILGTFKSTLTDKMRYW